MAQARSLVEAENRAILVALLASLVLHAGLLAFLPQFREARQRLNRVPDPLHARVVELPGRQVAQPVVAAPPVEAPKPAPQAAHKRPQPLRPVPAPVAPQAPTLTDAPVLARTEPSAAEPTVSAVPAPSTLAVAPSPPQASPPVSDALDAGTLAQYRLSLMSAARRFKRYPRVALDQNWQGRVEIRMVIAASGQIAALTVRVSAGYTVLDEHALEMIERAKEMAPIPPALRGKEFTLDIPVVFSLREAGG